jgi:mannose-6-phosphate isomerase-like protein (cupin superfamily)
MGHMFLTDDPRHTQNIEIKEWQHAPGEAYPVKRYTGGWEYWNVMYGALHVKIYSDRDGILRLEHEFTMYAGDTVLLPDGPWKQVATVGSTPSGGTTVRQRSAPGLNEEWKGA